ncbi:MAG: hypothetical protein AAF802_11480 [Planctomycetota bacterium]
MIDHQTDWNPTWYVATAQEDGWRTTEIAIERRALIPRSAETEAAFPTKHWFMRVRPLRAGQADFKEWMPKPSTRIRIDLP